MLWAQLIFLRLNARIWLLFHGVISLLHACSHNYLHRRPLTPANQTGISLLPIQEGIRLAIQSLFLLHSSALAWLFERLLLNDESSFKTSDALQRLGWKVMCLSLVF